VILSQYLYTIITLRRIHKREEEEAVR